MIHKALEHLDWVDRERAGQDLAAFFDGGHPELEARLVEVLEECPEPQRVALYLGRYVEAAESLGIMARMHGDPPLLDLLAGIFSHSLFLSDILCRYPQYALWLREEAVLDRPRSVEEIQTDCRAMIQEGGGFEAALHGMRRFRQREILRIAARDIVDRASLVSVTEDLSNLADAMLETAIEYACADIEPPVRKVPPQPANGRRIHLCHPGHGETGRTGTKFQLRHRPALSLRGRRQHVGGRIQVRGQCRLLQEAGESGLSAP